MALSLKKIGAVVGGALVAASAISFVVDDQITGHFKWPAVITEWFSEEEEETLEIAIHKSTSGARNIFYKDWSNPAAWRFCYKETTPCTPHDNNTDGKIETALVTGSPGLILALLFIKLRRTQKNKYFRIASAFLAAASLAATPEILKQRNIAHPDGADAFYEMFSIINASNSTTLPPRHEVVMNAEGQIMRAANSF